MPVSFNPSRRSFLGAMGSTSLLAVAEPLRPWLPGRNLPDFAYVATRSHDPSQEGIHVFHVDRGLWSHVQFMATPAPSALATSAQGSCLFVANAIDTYRHLPTATVESFRICRTSGRLEPLSRRPLSLSTTRPESLAVSADGRLLAVASASGSTYTLLPIDSDGQIGTIASLRKEIHPAHRRTSASPRALLFDADSRLITADPESGHVSVFRAEEGALPLSSRHGGEHHPNAAYLLMLPEQNQLVVADHKTGRLHLLPYSQGSIAASAFTVSSSDATGHTFALAHVETNYILSAWTSGSESGMQTWRVKDDQLTGKESWSDTKRRFDRLTVAPQDRSIYAYDARRGRLDRFQLDRASGQIIPTAGGITLPAPSSIAWHRPHPHLESRSER